jgi:hypothetical protein
VDVRSQLAEAAGVSSGNITKVKKLVESAHPRIKQALKAEEVSIHQAWKWCRLPAQQQIEKFEEYRSRKGVNLTSRRLIQKHVARLSPNHPCQPNLGDLLKAFLPYRPAAVDSILVSEIDAPGNIAYFTKNALRSLRTMEESKCTTETC